MGWKYFKKEEFACPCCHQNKTNISLINRLDILRGRMGVPFKVTSGYRCASHNASPKVGGADASIHLKGGAADISTAGWNGNQKYLIISRAMALGFYGIGIGKTLIHLDIRSGPPVLWVYPD